MFVLEEGEVDGKSDDGEDGEGKKKNKPKRGVTVHEKERKKDETTQEQEER